MNRLNISRFALAVLLAGSALAAASAVQAHPMMGECGMPNHDGPRHEHMMKHWEQRQVELRNKLHLTPTQEAAWGTFTQEMKRTTTPLTSPLDREALSKLSTPERMEKMNAVHEANFATMQANMKKRTEATRTFYAQLSSEQQKVFDTQTLPTREHRRNRRD